MKLFLAFLALCFCITAECQQDMGHMGKSSGTMEMRAQLRKKLLRDYDRLNIPDDMSCKLGMSLLNMDMDKEKEILHANVWMKLMWRDKRLSWDKGATSIDLLRVGHDEIWKPDIALFNSANMKEMMNCWPKANPVVYSTGDVVWISPCNVMTHCNTTVREHPNDEHHCRMTFGSWAFDKNMMKWELWNKRDEVDLHHFEHRRFNVMSSKATINERTYPGIPDPFMDVTFDMRIKRINRRETCMVE